MCAMESHAVEPRKHHADKRELRVKLSVRMFRRPETGVGSGKFQFGELGNRGALLCCLMIYC